jgi:hypothetical protein
MKEKEQIAKGQAVLDRVYQLTNDELNVMDTNISFAIRRVGRAMSPKGENYLAAGADLAEFLISDKPICRGTRLMLAALVLGELRNPPRKPEMHPNHPKVVEAVDMFNQRISDGWTIEAAKHDVKQKLGIPRSTLGDYIKMVEERKKAIADVKKSLGWPE